MRDIEELLNSPDTPEKAMKDLMKAEARLSKAQQELHEGDNGAAFNDLRAVVKELLDAEDQRVDVAARIDALLGNAPRFAEDATEAAKQFAGTGKKIDKEIARAEDDFADAGNELAKGDPEGVTNEFEKAREHGQTALEEAGVLAKPRPNNRDKIDVARIPVEFGLSQNFPNPFKPGTTICFHFHEQVRLRWLSTTSAASACVRYPELPWLRVDIKSPGTGRTSGPQGLPAAYTCTSSGRMTFPQAPLDLWYWRGS